MPAQEWAAGQTVGKWGYEAHVGSGPEPLPALLPCRTISK
jgi:hypothetical protein